VAHSISNLAAKGSIQLLCGVLITGCDFNANLARLTPRQTFPRLEAKGASWSAKNMEELLGVVTGVCEEGSVPKQVLLEVAASVCELIRSPLAFFDDGSAVTLMDLAPPRMVAEFKAFLATFPEFGEVSGLLEPILSSRLRYTQLCMYVDPALLQAQAQAFENKMEKKTEEQAEITRLWLLSAWEDFEQEFGTEKGNGWLDAFRLAEEEKEKENLSEEEKEKEKKEKKKIENRDYYQKTLKKRRQLKKEAEENWKEMQALRHGLSATQAQLSRGFDQMSSVSLTAAAPPKKKKKKVRHPLPFLNTPEDYVLNVWRRCRAS